jgi:phosphoribosylaminoimidazole (AIR) synthetase
MGIGLVIVVAKDGAEALLARLHEAGEHDAAVIGGIREGARGVVYR